MSRKPNPQRRGEARRDLRDAAQDAVHWRGRRDRVPNDRGSRKAYQRGVDDAQRRAEDAHDRLRRGGGQ